MKKGNLFKWSNRSSEDTDDGLAAGILTMQKEDIKLYESPYTFVDNFMNMSSLVDISLTEFILIGNFHFYSVFLSGKSSKRETVQSLDISYCQNITDIGVEFIARSFPKLRKFTAVGCANLTETSVKHLAEHCTMLEFLNFDSTSCRFKPKSIPSEKISQTNCPFLSSIHPNNNEFLSLPSSFTQAKVVIIKTVPFRNVSLAAKLFGDISYDVSMDTSGTTLYRFGSFSVLECVENSAVELFLSENCIIILPYDTTITIVQQLFSVESRLRFVLGILESFQVACIPMTFLNSKKGQYRSKKIKSMKEIAIANMAGAPRPKNEYVARYKYFVEKRLEFIEDKSDLVSWMESNKPFSDVPNLVPSEVFDHVVEKLLEETDTSFLNVQQFVDAMESVDNFSSYNWPAIIQFLVETGNLWRERFVGFDEILPGPSHTISSMSHFVKLLAEFRNNSDSTAMAEDIRCFPPETGFSSTARILQAFEKLTPDISRRLFLEFEFVGLGMFRSNSSFPMNALPEDPVISSDHFVITFDEKSSRKAAYVLGVVYQLSVYPPFIFERLLAVLANCFPPTLAWKNGAFFYDAFLAEILIKADDDAMCITVQFSGDIISQRPEVEPSFLGTCSIIHTICCAVLNKFSPENLFETKISGLKLLPPNKIRHVFNNQGKIGSFSRHFDSSIPRCGNCLLDPLFLSCIDRLFSAQMTNQATAVVNLFDKTASVQILLNTSFKSAESYQAAFCRDRISLPDVSNIEKLTFEHGGKKFESENSSNKVDIEYFREKTGNLGINLSKNGRIIKSTTFEGNAQLLTLTLHRKGDSNIDLPISYNSSVNLNGEVKSNVIIKPGMQLETRNKTYPHLFYVSFIKKVKDDNMCLVELTGMSQGFSYWQKLDIGDNCFPCGFVEYLNENPEKMKEFKVKNPKFTGDLQIPKSSGDKPTPAFDWLTYLSDINSKSFHGAEFAPVEAFNSESLMGFTPEFLLLKKLKNVQDATSLGSICSKSYQKIVEDVESSYRKPAFLHSVFPFITLPSTDYTWEMGVWPSRFKMTSTLIKTNRKVNLLCGFPQLLHFTNSPLFDVDVGLKTSPQVARFMAILFIRMLNQPRFLPDKTFILFPNLVKPCPFVYSAFEGQEKFKIIERAIRDNICAYLDYLLICAYTNKPKEIVDIFLKSADLRGLLGGLPEESTALDVMPIKEEDFFTRNQNCPRMMCEEHAFHFMRYHSSGKIDNFSNWSPDDYRNRHGSLLTQCRFNRLEFDKIQATIEVDFPLLTELNLTSCQLTKFPVELCNLRYLTTLTLADNQLSDLPPDLAKLSQTLRQLDVSRNNIEQSMPEIVFELKNLVILQANGLNLSAINSKIANLNKLQVFSANPNSFSSIPEEFSRLTDLEILDLSGFPLPSFNESNLYFEKISEFCQVNKIPQSILTEFGENSSFDLQKLRRHFFDKIPRLRNDFPTQVFKLRRLTSLSLANQGFKVVPSNIGQLGQLTEVNLANCLDLETISAEISVDSLRNLILDGCQNLKTPPKEIRSRGLLAVLAYFRRLAAGSVVCRRCKLMFVGLGGAGKTTLTRAIMGNSDGDSDDITLTDGIDISNWKIDGVDFRLWDFAGQVVYYNTHQFFLSDRAVYLVVWNMRLGYEHSGLDFWLSSIAVHAPQAPVLVVGTQADLVSQERTRLPETLFRQRFGSIQGFHYISSLTGVGIAELRNQIVQVALNQKHMGEQIPSAWISLEENLLSKSQSNVLMYDEVRRLADMSGVFDEDETFDALEFLSDLGSLQFFRHDFLRDRVIINPQWIVDVLAALISVQKDQQTSNGMFNHSDLAVIWKSYPPELHAWLLKLTEAFDLTFPLKTQQGVSVIPCLLPEEVPQHFKVEFQNRTPMELKFLFKYLPTGLFNRVQVRLCQFSDESSLWRSGSVLRKSGHLALMTQSDATTISVKVVGTEPENLAFLILEVLDTLINEAFHGVKPDYLFTCPECVSAQVRQPSLFQRSKILRASELHVPFIQCSEYFHCVSTQELRQLMPAESAVDFDSQLVRSVKQLTGLSKSLRNDVLIVGSNVDAKENSTSKEKVTLAEFVEDVTKGLQAHKLRCSSVTDPENMPFNQLAALLRSTRLILCCVTPHFMACDQCQAVLFCARETYRKALVIAFIQDFDWKSNPSLAFLIGSDVFIRAINRAKYHPPQIVETLKLRLEQSEAILEISEATSKNHPSVFISYSWLNSAEAVSKGTRSLPGAVGVSDPRKIKQILAEKGFSCWLDIEQVGRGAGALFENIALGLRHAKVVVVCISDEYVESENCLREFRFATTACALPVVLCAVGTGCLWKQSEVTLVASLSARINCQNESNLNDLVAAIENHVKPIKEAETEITTGPNLELQSATSLHYSEMLELAQRRFIRHLQLVSGEISRKYPRLVTLDVAPDFQPTKTQLGLEDQIDQSKWCVRFFCEHEGGWHLVHKFVGIDDSRLTEPASQMMRQFAGFMSRILSLVRYSNTDLPSIFRDRQFSQNFMTMLERLVRFEEPFSDSFFSLQNFAISIDSQLEALKELQICQLALGKELWLCPQHRANLAGHDKPPEIEAVDDSLPDVPKDITAEDSVVMKPSNFTEQIDNAKIEHRPLTAAKTSRACCIQ